jgi:hypothetical protein
MPIKRIDILGINGTPMRVLLVSANEQRPNHPTASPAKKDTVEFYDTRYPHTPDGQFIVEYYLETLQQSDRFSGLYLYGDEANWKIDARTKCMVLDWAAYHTYIRP